MDAIFNKYERLPRWLQFIVVIFVDIGIYCILSILSYALYAMAIIPINTCQNFNWIERAYGVFHVTSVSIVALLLFRLIVLTYFEGDGISKLDVTLTAIYSQFGVYAFIYFMRDSVSHPVLSAIIDGLKYSILHPDIFSPVPYSGWLLFENVFDVVSITILIILILQIFYLQRSQNKTTQVATYWKVVMALAIIFCVVYLFVVSIPPCPLPITGGVSDNTPLVYITAVTGLVSAVSAFYTQILAGKKMKMEMEQLAAQKASVVPAKISKNKVGGKSTKPRKSK